MDGNFSPKFQDNVRNVRNLWRKDLPSDCFYKYGNGNNLKYKTEVEDPCQKLSGQRSSGNIAL